MGLSEVEEGGVQTLVKLSRVYPSGQSVLGEKRRRGHWKHEQKRKNERNDLYNDANERKIIHHIDGRVQKKIQFSFFSSTTLVRNYAMIDYVLVYFVVCRSNCRSIVYLSIDIERG